MEAKGIWRGNFLARLPGGRVAASAAEAGCVLYIRHTRRAVEYTTGYGYGQEYAIYAFCADGSGDAYKLYGAYNPPPMAGIAGQITGDPIPMSGCSKVFGPTFSSGWNGTQAAARRFSSAVTGRGCCLAGYAVRPVRVDVPDSVAGHAVTGVASEAFRDCESAQSIHLPDGVTWIGDDAFFGCGALEELNMPRSLTSVGASAFGGTGLRALIFPEGLTRIGRCAISTMSRLEALSLPATLTEMSEWNLESGSRLPRIVLPDSLTEIGTASSLTGRPCAASTSRAARSFWGKHPVRAVRAGRLHAQGESRVGQGGSAGPARCGLRRPGGHARRLV